MNYVMDFLAGADPTGVTTINRASKSTGDDKKKRLVGDIGGFAGGVAISSLLPAAALGGVGFALRGKNKSLSDQFINAAKGSADIVRPNKMLSHIKSVKHITNIGDNLSGLQRAIKNKRPVSAMRLAGKVSKLDSDISKKFYKGGDTGMGIARTMTALTALPAAGVSGLLNASSAHGQYSTVLKNREKMVKESSYNSSFISTLEKIATFGQYRVRGDQTERDLRRDSINKRFTSRRIERKKNRPSYQRQRQENLEIIHRYKSNRTNND